MAVMTQQRLRAFSARRFLGKNVADVTGERIGEVDDLIIDMESACAKYAVVGVGGILGLGEKHYIVPVQALSMNTETGALMMSVEKSRLHNAPTFDRDNPPDFADEQWSRSLYTYYGMQYPQQSSGQGWGMERVGPGYVSQQDRMQQEQQPGQQPQQYQQQQYGQQYPQQGGMQQGQYERPMQQGGSRGGYISGRDQDEQQGQYQQPIEQGSSRTGYMGTRDMQAEAMQRSRSQQQGGTGGGYGQGDVQDEAQQSGMQQPIGHKGQGQ